VWVESEVRGDMGKNGSLYAYVCIYYSADVRRKSSGENRKDGLIWGEGSSDEGSQSMCSLTVFG
jgi:hypothetical protein